MEQNFASTVQTISPNMEIRMNSKLENSGKAKIVEYSSTVKNLLDTLLECDDSFLTSNAGSRVCDTKVVEAKIGSSIRLYAWTRTRAQVQ